MNFILAAILKGLVVCALFSSFLAGVCLLVG